MLGTMIAHLPHDNGTMTPEIIGKGRHAQRQHDLSTLE